MAIFPSPSVIWRVGASAASGVEGSADSHIEFELTPASATDSTGHLKQTEFRLISGIGENPKVFGNGNELQDTNFEGFTAIITGFIQIVVPPGISGAGTRTNAFLQTKEWIVEPKVSVPLTTDFPKGLFGVRFNDVPEFNLSPTSNWGIILQDWTWTRISEQANRADFIATLRYNFGSVGTSPYTWYTAG